MTISPIQRRQTEDSIRAAMDRLLRGQIPSGGGCDITTVRLKDENAHLRRRLLESEQQIAELTEFRITAISRLAAQHDEITQLRRALAAHSNVRALPATTTTRHAQ